MYDQFFNFRTEPFRLSPDHTFAYVHKGYEKARAYMSYAFMRAEGFVMITGRPGTGKTTLVSALVEQLAGENVSVANLVCTQLQADDLLKMVAYEFGVGVDVSEKGELLQRLTRQLHSWHRDGRRALLIVDEAQDLSISAMEELRLLTNIQSGGKPLLQIFLLGQPELRELILSPELEQVHQRLVASSNLRALEVEETRAYITHRLSVVGWQGNPVISLSIFPLIHKYSEGIPRRINLICSRLLLHCAVEQRERVTVGDLKEVIGELQDESLAVASGLSDRDFDIDDEWDTQPIPAPEASVEPSQGVTQAGRKPDVAAPQSSHEAPAPATSAGEGGDAGKLTFVTSKDTAVDQAATDESPQAGPELSLQPPLSADVEPAPEPEPDPEPQQQPKPELALEPEPVIKAAAPAAEFVADSGEAGGLTMGPAAQGKQGPVMAEVDQEPAPRARVTASPGMRLAPEVAQRYAEGPTTTGAWGFATALVVVVALVSWAVFGPGL